MQRFDSTSEIAETRVLKRVARCCLVLRRVVQDRRALCKNFERSHFLVGRAVKVNAPLATEHPPFCTRAFLATFSNSTTQSRLLYSFPKGQIVDEVQERVVRG